MRPAPFNVRIRRALETDLDFIVHSWVNSHKEHFFAQPIWQGIFQTQHRQLVLETINRCSVLVAHDADDSDVVLGWICGEMVQGFAVVHYVYVKDTLMARHHGVARALFETWEAANGIVPKFRGDGTRKNPTIITHWADGFAKKEIDKKSNYPGSSWKALVKRYWLIYHPYLFMCPQNHTSTTIERIIKEQEEWMKRKDEDRTSSI